MVGTLMLAGAGRRTVADVRRALEARDGCRRATALAAGSPSSGWSIDRLSPRAERGEGAFQDRAHPETPPLPRMRGEGARLGAKGMPPARARRSPSAARGRRPPRARRPGAWWPDEAELDHRAGILDEARVRGAAGGRERGRRPGLGLDRRRRRSAHEGPGWVRKRSPSSLAVEGDARLLPAALAALLDPVAEVAPSAASLKRMLKVARASAGMTLIAGLPTSMVVNSRFEASKCAVPPSSGAAIRRSSRRTSRGSGSRPDGGRRRGPAGRARRAWR